MKQKMNHMNPKFHNPLEVHRDTTVYSDALNEILKLYPKGKQSLIKMFFGAASAAVKVASKNIETHGKVTRALPASPERRRVLQEAGAALREMREFSGLTLKELSDALHLPNQSLLAAVESGAATLSFELILRMAALLSRHDPIPFIIKYTRTYNPEVWMILEDWGLGKLPLQIEREREFINIYRSHDETRHLSDEAFQRVLNFTRHAFEMAMQFALEKDKGSYEKMD